MKSFQPGPANAARVTSREGENWGLVLVKELRHSPDRVWQAITDPAQLSQWAPFDADHNLGVAGATVTLSTVGAPSASVSPTSIIRAEAPTLLEYEWGGGNLRWELEATEQGTRLTLWANINRRYIAMGAAGWHICLEVLSHLLSGEPVGRIVAGDALKFGDWQRLNKEYGEQFGVEAPSWSPE